MDLIDDLGMRDYAFFLLNALALMGCVSVALLLLSFRSVRPHLSRCTTVHAVGFVLSCALIQTMFALSLALDEPILNLGKNQGPVAWKIIVALLVQLYFLFGFLAFNIRDIRRLNRWFIEHGIGEDK